MNEQITEPSTAGDLEVGLLSHGQIHWFDQTLNDQHYLGAGRAVGDYLRQIVKQNGIPVALLVWGPACYALKDRDLWIGWSANQRTQRLKLIVQNRRFLLLTPNPHISQVDLKISVFAFFERFRRIQGCLRAKLRIGC